MAGANSMMETGPRPAILADARTLHPPVVVKLTPFGDRGYQIQVYAVVHPHSLGRIGPAIGDTNSDCASSMRANTMRWSVVAVATRDAATDVTVEPSKP
jgi:hypothetical protein